MTTVAPTPGPAEAADRPIPDWELILRRNSIERLKRERPPMDVREELPELIARGYEDIPEQDVIRLHWWGIAHDKPKVGSFMVRVKVPNGLVQPDQLRALGRIAGAHSRDEVELTTRQGVQMHWVPMAKLPEVLAEIEAAGLSTAGAEGDTVRNITGCPVAGLTADEPFDVTPVIAQASAFFTGNPDFSNLPRKHKYSISACPAQCNAPEVHDVALVATAQDGRPGFGVRIGGGMTSTPRISRDIGVFVPVEDTLEVLQAITNAWQRDLRYRVSRAKSRIKFMMDDYGPDGVRAKVEEHLGRRLDDGVAPAPVAAADHMGVHPQRQDGLVYVGVPVPSGRVTGTVLAALGDLLAEVGADLRFTRQQNFIIGNVPAAQVDRLTARLAELGLPVDRGRAYARSVACTSHRFCNYSVADTKDKLQMILDRLTDRFGAEQVGDLGIHLDGCPHACAQHWIGEIGLQGTTTRVAGEAGRVEAYDLSVGGGLGQRSAIGRRLVRRVPTGEIDAVLERLVAAWLAARATRSATFGDFIAERSDEQLLAIATGAVDATGLAAPEEGTTGVLVHLPGPLLAMVGGADQVEVTALTVGEALAAVARENPAFGAAVIPGGKVDKTYLIAIEGEDIRNLQGLATPVAPGTEITVVMAMAGG